MKRIWAALVYLATGLLTAIASWLAIGVLLLSVVILPLLPITAPIIRRIVDLDRQRLARYAGVEVPSPPPLDGPWLHRAQGVTCGPERSGGFPPSPPAATPALFAPEADRTPQGS